MFEIYKSAMGVIGSKGELRGVKGSYWRHRDYDVIGRLPVNQVPLLMTSQGSSPR